MTLPSMAAPGVQEGLYRTVAVQATDVQAAAVRLAAVEAAAREDIGTAVPPWAAGCIA